SDLEIAKPQAQVVQRKLVVFHSSALNPRTMPAVSCAFIKTICHFPEKNKADMDR
ncbi:MAG: hypothetical protein ACI9HB_003240, partial [Gammaproteobacteria bacterium]